ARGGGGGGGGGGRGGGEPVRPGRELGPGAAPPEPVDVDADGGVAPQRGEAAEEQGPLALSVERGGEALGAPHRDVPVRRARGHVLDVAGGGRRPRGAPRAPAAAG